MTADGWVAFHQDHVITTVGQVQCRLNTGNSAADNQCPAGHWNTDGFQGLIASNTLYRTLADSDRLFRCFFHIFVDPTALLPDVANLAVKIIESGGFGRISKGGFMKCRRAAGYHNIVQFFFLNGIDDQVLTRVGTHIYVVFGKNNTGVF